MLKLPALVIALLSTQVTEAQLAIPGLDNQALNTVILQDQTLAQTGLAVNEDDLISEQNISDIQLTEQQLHEAKVWGLTEEEEKRYLFLMQNRSQIYYKGLRQTPLDILGINARNEAERDHFAELAAKQEAQKVAKNIAWNNAFHRAYNKLYARVPVIGDFDPSPYSPYAHKPLQLHQGDSLYLFLRPDNAVKTIFMLLVEAIENTPSTYLHLMFLKSDELAIQLWANQHQIPLELVNSGRITLNHGDLNYQALNVRKKVTPLLLLSKHGSSQVVDLGRF